MRKNKKSSHHGTGRRVWLLLVLCTLLAFEMSLTSCLFLSEESRTGVPAEGNLPGALMLANSEPAEAAFVYRPLEPVNDAWIFTPTLTGLQNGIVYDFASNGLTMDFSQSNIRWVRRDVLPASVQTELKKGPFKDGVLRLRGSGMFNIPTLTRQQDASLYQPGTEYEISFSYYVRSLSGTLSFVVEKTGGTYRTVKLLSSGSGTHKVTFHYDVGEQESNLAFRATGPCEVYIGPFSIQCLTVTGDVDGKDLTYAAAQDIHVLTREEALSGYTFDFTSGNAPDLGGAAVFFNPSDKAVNPVLRRALTQERGFGSRVLHVCNEVTGFHYVGINQILQQGDTVVVTFLAYVPEGAAINGLANLPWNGSAQVGHSCRLQASDAGNGMSNLTFTMVIEEGVNSIYGFMAGACNFFAASMTVKITH